MPPPSYEPSVLTAGPSPNQPACACAPLSAVTSALAVGSSKPSKMSLLCSSSRAASRVVCSRAFSCCEGGGILRRRSSRNRSSRPPGCEGEGEGEEDGRFASRRFAPG